MAHKRHLPIEGACEQPLEMGRLCGICRLRTEVDGVRLCSRLVAESHAMRGVLARVAAVAHTSSSVVVQGETGTGKEVVARLLHANGPRHAKAFIAVNVAALPGELLESELFGHVRGAFTGAIASTKGMFGEAHRGTLFLDEIAELPLPLQAKLLRVLQEGEARRVGESRPTKVDVRVVCATHRDLRAEVRGGRFREDLFYRLAVFELRVPPLRERKDDLLPLARMFAERLAAPGFSIEKRALARLLDHAWPGNVRELGNVVEHALALARGGSVSLEHLPDALARPGSLHGGVALTPALTTLAEAERVHVLHVLDACGGNQREAARVLGIGRSTLWRKLRGYADAEPSVDSK